MIQEHLDCFSILVYLYQLWWRRQTPQCTAAVAAKLQASHLRGTKRQLKESCKTAPFSLLNTSWGIRNETGAFDFCGN